MKKAIIVGATSGIGRGIVKDGESLQYFSKYCQTGYMTKCKAE